MRGTNLDPAPLSSDSRAGAFDMWNTGQEILPGWATAGEGLLVYHPNKTNTVTGDSNLVAGFGALETLAGNVDGSDPGAASPVLPSLVASNTNILTSPLSAH